MSSARPSRGQLTFDAEGNEGGPFHSRVLHVPSESSGLTIGRGYDCKSKTEAQIRVDLLAAGIALEKAKIIAKSFGMNGSKAKQFIIINKLEKFEITASQQVKLFEVTYREEAMEAKRICTKADVEAKYGKCDWQNLKPEIIDILVDLKYRGDYTPRTRSLLQKYIAQNDVAGLYSVIADRKNWLTVPGNRFEMRRDYLKKYLPKKP